MTRLLVIEDDPSLREEIANLLTLDEFQVFVAEDGQIGLAQARKEVPDLIICDIMMPVMDGYEVLAGVRADPVLRDVPFIFLTARSRREDMRKGMELGADDYITKPFSSYELITSIRTSLKKRQTINKDYATRIGHFQRIIAYAMPGEIREMLDEILANARILSGSTGEFDSQKIAATAQEIDRTANAMHRVIENYLAFINIAVLVSDPERKAALRQEVISNPCEIIKGVIDLKAYRAERWSDIDMLCENAPIKISREHLEKITLEMIDNALKFSPVGSPVEVRTVLDSASFILEFRNQGQPIAPEVIRLISATHPEEGLQAQYVHTGSGLWMVKWLLDLYGGRLEMDESIDDGARIIVQFDRAGDPA